MKKIIPYLSIILLTSFINLAHSSDSIYEWKFVQKNKIKELKFKSKESEKNNSSLKSIISENLNEEFCSSEKNLLLLQFKEISNFCVVKEKTIGNDILTATLICNDEQKISLLIKKNKEGNFIGESFGETENEDYILKTKSNISIEKIGYCSNN